MDEDKQNKLTNDLFNIISQIYETWNDIGFSSTEKDEKESLLIKSILVSI